MGGSSSKLEKALGNSFPEDERYFGLENFGNTCYCNSVLQALYYCQPFRKQVLNYLNEKDSLNGEEANLLQCLAELFAVIRDAKKKTGVVAPKKFIQKVKKENELFRSYMHQDAHEFLNYLLNEIDDILTKEVKAGKNNITFRNNGRKIANEPVADPSTHSKDGSTDVRTWIKDIFQGTLTNETKCLCCETVTSKEESFLDLSLDIEQNSSITSCLRNFSSTQVLNRNDKFYCDNCCSLQEAQKRMRVKRLPHILALHLKRFKYIEHLQRYKKLSYRVVFPLELKVCNTTDNAVDAEREYQLFGVVIHVGSGPNHGHYVSIVRSHHHWLIFDDEAVDLIDENSLQTVFGSAQDMAQSSDAAYILFYAAQDTTLS